MYKEFLFQLIYYFDSEILEFISEESTEKNTICYVCGYDCEGEGAYIITIL